MAALVGGRMEAVARRRFLFAPDYVRIAVLAAVSAAVHLWLIGHTSVTARDSIGFARYALSIQSPHATAEGDIEKRRGMDVIREGQQPPGYPAAVWLTAKFVRQATDLPLPDSTLLAAQVASSIAALLLVVPTYLLGRMLFGRAVGFAAALLMQVLPVPARLTSDGLTEGMYLLLVATALLLGVRAVRRPGVGGFLGCGLVVGLGYLVRPEAMLVAGAVGLVAAWLGISRRWPRDVAFGRLTALAVGIAFVATPYMLLIGGITNKPSPESIIKGNPREEMMKSRSGAMAAPVVDAPLFAKWMDPPVEGIPGRVAWGVEAVISETSKGLHYLPAVFAVIGVIVLRRRVATEPGLWVLLVLAGLNAALLVCLGARVGYVSERHTVLIVLIGCLFAAAALEPIAAALATIPRVGRFWSGRYAAAGLLLMLVATALPSALKPMHAHREGHKHAGRWLAPRLQHEDCLVDPFEWAQWYAWRGLYFVPPDPPDAKVIYSVLENDPGNPHSRLPRLQLAKEVAASGKLVYHWPEDVPPEHAEVHVYKTTR